MSGLERGIRNVVEGSMDGAYHVEQVNTAVRQLLAIVEGVRAADRRLSALESAAHQAALLLADETTTKAVGYNERRAAVYEALFDALNAGRE